MTATPATGGEGTDRGPRVLITGAAGGIGTAATAELRAQGASVVGVDLHGADIDCDVRDQPSVDRAVAAAIERLGGGLDVLINNAGLGAPQSAGVAPDDDALDVLAVNLVGPWRVTSAALPALRASRGRVVNVASGLAHITAPFATAYTMSKRGVVAYSDSLRLEEGDRITVTTVYPGFIRTPIHARSTAAGVPLEGAVPAERVEDAARALARAALGPPVRDLATTRQGAIGYAFARLAPRHVLDKVTTLRMRKLARRGHFDAGGIAGEYAERLLQR
jgi:NAD(P)-dependent dehydrogenase (short-subunit alcohol dehydrogenase family)